MDFGRTRGSLENLTGHASRGRGMTVAVAGIGQRAGSGQDGHGRQAMPTPCVYAHAYAQAYINDGLDRPGYQEAGASIDAHANTFFLRSFLLGREDKRHKYIAHNYIAHMYIGHSYIGHNCIGHNYVSVQFHLGAGREKILPHCQHSRSKAFLIADFK